MVKQMNWNIFLLIFLYVTLSISPYKAIGQELELETLIAGIKHYDSLVKSGTGTLFCEQPIQSLDGSEKREKLVYTIAFEGKKKIRVDFIKSNVRYRDNPVFIWDGEKTIIYSPKRDKYTRVDGRDLALDYRLDLRYWMTARGPVHEYLNNPTGAYLEKHIKDVKVLRTEKVDDILCYVLKVYDTTIWIAPEMGFRMIKRYCPVYLGKKGPGHVEFKRRIYYKEYKFDELTIWFPKRVEREMNKITPDGKSVKNISKSTLLVKDDFKLNVDVSDKFKLNIPPDTMIYDYPSKTYIPAREILK